MSLPRDLTPNWDFSESLTWRLQLRRVGATLRRCKPPSHKVLLEASPRKEWALYFVYLPDASALTPAHRFTLERLRSFGLGVFVVCAASSAQDVPRELLRASDALAWKSLGGFDFSGYALGLRHLAEKSPGANVFVMNDSVFGPLQDVRGLLSNLVWDFTGFTASSQLENHVQSYAFIMRNVTKQRLDLVSNVLPSEFAYDRMEDVILHQELAFARQASRHMAVGAYFYGDASLAPERNYDPTLSRSFELLEAGFPFLKRSLLGKHSGFQNPGRVNAELARRDHPIEPFSPSAQR